MDKIKAIKIMVHRAEGPTHLCKAKTFEGPNVWSLAQYCINEIRWTASKQGYDKTDFVVTYANGEEYKGRIDLTHPDNERQETSNLPDHIAQHCFFHIGQWRPSHLTPQQYNAFLAALRHDDPECEKELRDFWANHEVPSNWAKSPAALMAI